MHGGSAMGGLRRGMESAYGNFSRNGRLKKSEAERDLELEVVKRISRKKW